MTLPKSVPEAMVVEGAATASSAASRERGSLVFMEMEKRMKRVFEFQVKNGHPGRAGWP
jgi:hypothetical protein